MLSHSSGEPMPPSSHSGGYRNTRATPRFVFDLFWSRSTDVPQVGIGLNLTAGDVKLDELVSLQIPMPKQLSAGLRASLPYLIGVHCGFKSTSVSCHHAGIERCNINSHFQSVLAFTSLVIGSDLRATPGPPRRWNGGAPEPASSSSRTKVL
jgi:hypothetical protein